MARPLREELFLAASLRVQHTYFKFIEKSKFFVIKFKSPIILIFSGIICLIDWLRSSGYPVNRRSLLSCHPVIRPSSHPERSLGNTVIRSTHTVIWSPGVVYGHPVIHSFCLPVIMSYDHHVTKCGHQVIRSLKTSTFNNASYVHIHFTSMFWRNISNQYTAKYPATKTRSRQ